MDLIIKVENLTKSFGKEDILSAVSFNILKGKIIGITGVNGAGKTTLINLLVGFLDSDEGNIFYNFKSNLLNLKELKKENIFYRFLGISTQEGSFYPTLSVYDNLVLYGVLNNLKKQGLDEKINELLNLVSLSDKKKESLTNLSSGMQKRLDIACSLIHQPKIIFLDEPTAHLDEKNKKAVWSLVKKIKKEGTTVVITSHFVKDLKKVCDKVYLIKDKKIKNA